MSYLPNYEPKNGYYGQFSTDALIELYFPNINKGSCVEVGAANGVRGSNTLFFEQKGWRALCIEPNPEYWEYLEVRSETVCCACSDKEGDEVPFTVFNIGEKQIMSSLSGLKPDPRLIEEHGSLINESYEIGVKTRTLDNILKEQGFPINIDFISIDTEGTELDVLKGLDLSYWGVSLLVVENNYNDPEIQEYLEGFGYFKDARWKINDFYVKRNAWR